MPRECGAFVLSTWSVLQIEHFSSKIKLMQRVMIFVDGSNLFGSLKSLNLHVNSYEEFYDFILMHAMNAWSKSLLKGNGDARLVRIMWYEIGSLDEWDLSNKETQTTLRRWFENDSDLKNKYIARAVAAKADPKQVVDEAWNIYLDEAKIWYEQKKAQVESTKKFHFGVTSGTDFIEIVECGHLKIDILNRLTNEKGLDTTLAVDMVTLVDTYDIALVLTGDADSIPSIEHVKGKGKSVGIVEFIHGFPPEKKGRQASSKLRASADFIAPIYETDLKKSGCVEEVDRKIRK